MKLLVLICAVWVAVPTAPAQDASTSYEVAIRENVMVAMRDGVRLACDLYLPTSRSTNAAERFPTLVSRTPYNKAGLKNEATWYAERGYAVVAQDVRGRFQSEGDFYPFTQEGPDGYDTIEWAAAQSWSNGKVGTFGASYLAWDQYRAAMERPPHLVAMFANVGGSEFYHEFAYPGGAMNPGWGIWIVKSAETSPAAQSKPAARARLTEILKDPSSWLRLSARERGAVFEKLPVHQAIYNDFVAHIRLDKYWRDPAFDIPSGWDRMKDVPVLFISGWYDYFGRGVIKNYTSLSTTQKTPKRLIMGPWWHAVGASSCGDAFFGNEAEKSVRELTVRWFDEWLKGRADFTSSEPHVRYFRMGGGATGDAKGRRAYGGTWRTASSWPPSSEVLKLYLSGTGGLWRQPGEADPRVFEFDPEKPVPTIGGRYGIGSWTPNSLQNQVCRPGVLGCEDAEPLSSRSDVVVFQTEPLEVPVEVTGNPKVRLWVSSDARDTDFTAKLIDAAPDGYAAILADGQLRLRYRNGFDKEKLLTPGAVVEVTVELGPTSVLFAKGHRIRVDISSSNWPQFDPNPNTGAPVNSAQRGRKARNTVFLDASRPSHIELPTVPIQ